MIDDTRIPERIAGQITDRTISALLNSFGELAEGWMLPELLIPAIRDVIFYCLLSASRIEGEGDA